MLEAAELPRVPSQGNGGSGEILALGHLFDPHGPEAGSGGEGGQRARQRLAVRRCPARRRRARRGRPGGARRTRRSRSRSRRSPRRSRPTTPSSPASGATRARRRRCSGWARCSKVRASERAGHQAPVSFRILPRVLGQAERALADAQRGAATSLSSVTDNPVFLPPSPEHPRGRVFSTGGYHNAMAPQMLHALTVVYADLCRSSSATSRRSGWGRASGSPRPSRSSSVSR